MEKTGRDMNDVKSLRRRLVEVADSRSKLVSSTQDVRDRKKTDSQTARQGEDAGTSTSASNPL